VAQRDGVKRDGVKRDGVKRAARNLPPEFDKAPAAG
jgi:hypothetical protein